MKKIIPFIKSLPKKATLALGLAVFIIIALSLLTPKKEPVNTTISPTPNITPAIELPPVLPTQQTKTTLSFVWDKTPQIDIPTTLPYYQKSYPLITNQIIENIAKKLGFDKSNRKKTTNQNSYIYTNPTKSLVANSEMQSLTYSDISPLPTGKIDPGNVTKAALNFTTDIFKPLEINLNPNPSLTYFASDNHQTQASNQEQSNLVKIGIEQVINNRYRFLVSSITNASFTLMLNAKSQPQYFEIVGGIIEPKEIGTASPISWNTLKSVAESSALRLTSQNTIGNEYNLDTTNDSFFNINKVEIVYYSLPSTDIIQPVFLLTGDFVTPSQRYSDIQYLVPALSQGF